MQIMPMKNNIENNTENGYCPDETDRVIEYIVDEPGERLDASVSRNCEITRSAASRLIEDGAVEALGKKLTKKSEKLSVGALVKVVMPEPKLCDARPQDIDIDIVYEDDDIAVVNKPQGMVVHPAPGNPDGTLVNALMYRMHGSLSTINAPRNSPPY